MKAKHSKRDVAVSLKYYSSFADDPDAAFKRTGAREPRATGQRTRRTDTPVETDISADIRAALSIHPLVAKSDDAIVRYNSGRFGGRSQYRFNSADGHSDLRVTRTDGRSALIEVKRNKRAIGSFLQLKFLINNWATHYCGIARSVEDAICIVEALYAAADASRDYAHATSA